MITKPGVHPELFSEQDLEHLKDHSERGPLVPGHVIPLLSGRLNSNHLKLLGGQVRMD